MSYTDFFTHVSGLVVISSLQTFQNIARFGLSYRLLNLFMIVVWVSSDLIFAQTSPGTTPASIIRPGANVAFSRDLLVEFRIKDIRDYVITWSDHVCGVASFCNSSLGRYETWKCAYCEQCFCDDKCWVYGDCCLDVLLNDYPPIGLSLYLSKFLSCVQPFPAHENITLVNRCPVNFNTSAAIVKFCEDPDLGDVKQAMVVTDSSRMTFRNEYCAKCHGIESVKQWSIQVRCDYRSELSTVASKHELWMRIVNDTRCIVKVSPPDGVPTRSCVPQAEMRCNASGLWKTRNPVVESLCTSFKHPVKIWPRNLWYYNIFCALCDGADLNDRSKFCLVPREGREFGTAPLSVLLDFSSEISEPTPKDCRVGEVFDPITEVCQTLHCSPRRTLEANQCEPVYSSAQWLGYSFSLTLTTGNGTEVSDLSNLTYDYEALVRRALANYQPYVLTPMTMTVHVTANATEMRPSEQRFHDMTVEGRVLTVNNSSMGEFEDAIRLLGTTPLTERGNRSSIILHPSFRACAKMDTTDENFTSIFERTSISDSETWLHPTCLSCTTKVDYVDIEDLLPCPHVKYDLPNRQFSLDLDASTLFVWNRPFQLNRSDYRLCERTLKLCSRTLDSLATMSNISATQSDQMSEERFIITVANTVCVALSMFCLLLTFTIYCLLPKLRTLPGMNTMFLVVHLFLAQLSFLVGIRAIDSASLCQAMGLLIHYFWLATFAWMAICGYHMFKVFSDLLQSRHDPRSERKILLRYVILSSCSVLLVVVATVCYHLATTNGTEIGYGGRQRCFITQSIVLGVAFTAPLGLVMICNIYCFVRTVISIRNIPDVRKASHQSNRHHVLVYFRLSVLLGFSWIFGFLNAFFKYILLEYLFVILTGCQGIFIFLAFCVNRRTFELLKEKLKNSSSNRKGSSSTPYTESTSF